jgi:hypothetical protein
MTARTITPWVVALAAFALETLGCGASERPPPNDERAAAETDIGRAQAGGADFVPEARLHLQFAQEDLQKSKQLSDDSERSRTLSTLARTEAQLAFSLAKVAAIQAQQSKLQTDPRESTGH